MPPHSMATFRAHNVDYDSSDSEVDDTKELQIEEALKLYQIALRYHSEGPRSYNKAKKAYFDLFSSEIFAYDESLSEFKRWETLPEYDELLQQTFDPVAQTTLVAGENAPNTLPQILHLAYKNSAQFLLDVLCNNIQTTLEHSQKDVSRPIINTREANNPLKQFAEALDKDDTDLDIWRRSAKVATWAGSWRIARFCLEAVLDGEQDGLESLFEAPGIDEILALHDLGELTLKLKDDLASLLGPLKSKQKRNLSIVMKKLVDPYPALKSVGYEQGSLDLDSNKGKKPSLNTLNVDSHDWNAVGKVILSQLRLETEGHVDAGIGISFKLSPSDSATKAIEMTPQAVASTQQELVASIDSTRQEQALDDVVLDAANDGYVTVSDARQEIGNAEANPMEVINSPKDMQQENQYPEQSSRKRSPESAGLENPEGGRSRSKRVRASARWTVGGERIDTAKAEAMKETSVDEIRQEALRSADLMAYETIEPILKRVDVQNLIAPSKLDQYITEDSMMDTTHERFFMAVKDLYATLKSCEPRTIEAIQTDSFTDQLTGVASRQAGLNVFLGHDGKISGEEISQVNLMTDTGLDNWVDEVNSSWCLIKDAAWNWLCALLKPKDSLPISDSAWSLYMCSTWSDELKLTMRLVSRMIGEYAYENSRNALDDIEHRYVHEVAEGQAFYLTTEEWTTINLIEAMFEIQVDSFAHLKAQTLTSDQHLRKIYQIRLNRWSQLAMNAIRLLPSKTEQGEMQNLQVRHIWAQATYISLDEDTTQSYNLACVRDLYQLMRALNNGVIQLPNNDTIGELSMATVEAKLRRMNMKDFFLRTFGEDKDDDDSALAIIHSLEPLLELAESKIRKTPGNSVADHNDDFITIEDYEAGDGSSGEVADFIVQSNPTLRLALWRRLRDAYQTLALKSMVVFCDFRTIDIIIEELQSENYKNTAASLRTNNLVRWLRLVDDLIVRLLSYRKESTDFLEYIDAEQVQRSMNSLAGLLSILHAFSLLDDQVTVGHCQTPGPARGSAFKHLSLKFNDMIMRIWTLQYILLKEAIEQYPEAFNDPREDRLNYLRAVHHSAGPRFICNAAKKTFLKVERDELLELSDNPESNWETCQVLLDLYGLKCTQHLNELADHGCNDFDPISRKEAIKILGFLLAQADKIPHKDLHKAELKSAIEKVHEALGRLRPSESNMMNKKAVGMYIKGAINPLNLYASLKGTLAISTKTVQASEMPIASKGWYFLLGKISYNKFHSAKRPLPQGVSAEDLEHAANFFLLDLEYSSEQWETWYRLGQTYDLQVEEAVSWNSEKLTSAEVLTLQRQTINCYAMAISCAVRNGIEENMPHQSKTIAQLYGDYGIRLYASSREPFSMKPFSIKEQEERIFNRVDHTGTLMYKAPSFVTLKLFAAWRLASILLREAIKRNSETWLHHYTLGKCLWKMYNAKDDVVGKGRRPHMNEVIEAFSNAVKECPKPKSSKEEPILEPHYKIASIAHKLVGQGLDNIKGSEIIRVSRFASKIPVPTEGDDDWEEYILKILKTLRSADKASWHHRMTARAAKICYEGSGKSFLGAMAAKHEFTLQMFTKIMALQVWRPACERPGRHFVYKTRYMRFFVDLLERTNDRSNLELLVRRLRKKVGDYNEHKDLWQDVSLKLVKILRNATQTPFSQETAIFQNVLHEEFMQRADALERWVITAKDNPVLEVLREATELKRLNGSYVRPIAIDDLMTDSYVQLYVQVASTLPIRPASPIEKDIKPEASTDTSKPSTGEVVPKQRIKGVGRRELLKRAEIAGSNTNSLVLPERRQSTRDREEPSETSGTRVLVSVVIPTIRRPANYTVVHNEDDSDSELSDMSANEIDEIEDELPSALKDRLGVGRKEVDPVEQDMEEEEDLTGLTGENDSFNPGEDAQIDDSAEIQDEEQYDAEVEEDDLEEVEDPPENSEIAEDADDEGVADEDASAVEIDVEMDESAMISEQMAQESAS